MGTTSLLQLTHSLLKVPFAAGIVSSTADPTLPVEHPGIRLQQVC